MACRGIAADSPLDIQHEVENGWSPSRAYARRPLRSCDIMEAAPRPFPMTSPTATPTRLPESSDVVPVPADVEAGAPRNVAARHHEAAEYPGVGTTLCWSVVAIRCSRSYSLARSSACAAWPRPTRMKATSSSETMPPVELHRDGADQSGAEPKSCWIAMPSLVSTRSIPAGAAAGARTPPASGGSPTAMTCSEPSRTRATPASRAPRPLAACSRSARPTSADVAAPASAAVTSYTRCTRSALRVAAACARYAPPARAPAPSGRRSAGSPLARPAEAERSGGAVRTRRAVRPAAGRYRDAQRGA